MTVNAQQSQSRTSTDRILRAFVENN